MELRNFYTGRHLYSPGRPSRWASTHILVMAALYSRCGHYIFALWFLSSSSIFFYSSPNLSGHRLNIYHTSTHAVVSDIAIFVLKRDVKLQLTNYTCCGLSANLECRSEMCCTRLAANAGLKKVKNRHLVATVIRS